MVNKMEIKKVKGLLVAGIAGARDLVMLWVFTQPIFAVETGRIIQASDYQPADYQLWPIDGSEGLDLSGLTRCGDELVTVSDKKDRQLYRLIKRADTYALEIKAVVPPLPPLKTGFSQAHWVKATLDRVKFDGNHDLEGVACLPDHRLWMVSENRLAAFEVNLSTGTSTVGWLSDSLYAAGQAAGFFQKYNAFFEGIALNHDQLFLAIEREPRGIVRADISTDTRLLGQVKFLPLPNNLGLDFAGRAEDVAGLDFNGESLYTLERNAAAVCQRDPNTLLARKCISYRAVEDQIGYADTRYRKAEGLLVEESAVTIIFDNNNNTVGATDDRRGRLLQIPHAF